MTDGGGADARDAYVLTSGSRADQLAVANQRRRRVDGSGGPVLTVLSGSAMVGWVLACAFGVFVGAVARLSAHQTASAYPVGADPVDFEAIRRIVRTGGQVRERRLAATVLHMAHRTLSIPFAPKAFSCVMALAAMLGLAQVVLEGSWLGLVQAVVFGTMAAVLPAQARRQRQRASQAAAHALEALDQPPAS